jgi:hypothetical protein
MRKVIFLLLFLCTSIIINAQVPDRMNFQTVLHHTEGSIMPNQSVKMIINILAESANGDIVYREEHLVTSNEFGLVNIQIGTGDVLYGAWTDIEWRLKDQYLMVEMDTTASGNNYVDMGVSQLLSVPYALYAGDSEVSNIWQNNDNGIHFSSGNLGIQTDVPTQDIEIAEDGIIQLSSSSSDYQLNDLVQVQMAADTAQPNINWRDENQNFAASFSSLDFETNPLVSRKTFLLSTGDLDFSRRSRLEVKYDENLADLLFKNSKLIIDGQFISGDADLGTTNSFYAHNWVMNGHQFGLGDKNWEFEGVYNNAAAELYSNGNDNFLLLNTLDELNRTQLILRRGNAEWVIGSDYSFYFKRNDAKKLRIMPDGKIKIGSNDPLFKLDVYGNVNIPVGYSYLIGGGKNGKYAEYFQAEEAIEMGALVGINLQSGLVRAYQEGDAFLGIASESSGFISNTQYANDPSYVLVGLEGLMEYKSQKLQQQGQQLFTNDGKLIGQVIDEMVYLK